MRIAHEVTVTPARSMRGTIVVPGDKSISHRYALLAAIAEGTSTLHGYAPGGDCASTLACLRALGVAIERNEDHALGPVVTIVGRGGRPFDAPEGPLDCGNSGSTMRMLSGLIAAHPITATLIGDRSLTRRPMRRIMGPLVRMGARIHAMDDRPPLTITGGALEGIDFVPDVPSAQVKSAVLLAGLQARGRCRVTESTLTRDHTERAVEAFGGTVRVNGLSVEVDGSQRLRGLEGRVPGDLSSAAFPAAAASALTGSDVTIAAVGLNPTRTAILGVLQRLGADVRVEAREAWQGEPVGTIRVRAQGLGSLELGAEIVPAIIDELPVLGALATAGGELRVTGAAELRVKESDRIASLVSGLRALGADADELPDGFHIRGTRRLTGGVVDAHDDHRLAMAFAIAALNASGPVTIRGAEAAAVSYPTFFDDLDRLRT